MYIGMYNTTCLGLTKNHLPVPYILASLDTSLKESVEPARTLFGSFYRSLHKTLLLFLHFIVIDKKFKLNTNPPRYKHIMQ